jgi:hypothetical protein
VGTNYVLRQTECPACHRTDEIHIGKKSHGWSFSFRGYRHQLLDPSHPDWGFEHNSPFGEPVLSRADWIRVVGGYDGRVFDEYHREIADPVAWLKGLEPPDARQQRWEDEHMGSFWQPDERDWRDAEGFRFYDGEFS